MQKHQLVALRHEQGYHGANIQADGQLCTNSLQLASRLLQRP